MEEQIHKRRVRYKGTHPKTFKEKYKEHAPEQYPDTIEKVIGKGNTPAGMHISICVEEILEFLQIKPGQTGIDATLGYGGHTSEMLKCLKGQGHVYGLDADPIEIEKTHSRLREQGFGANVFTTKQMNFAKIDQLVEEIGPVNFVLADLGVSSMQIDNPERGFTYKKDGPLDLRLNPQKGETAAERLKEMDQEEIYGMLVENADEPYAEEISKEIVNEMKRGRKIDTTLKLREVIEKSLQFLPLSEREKAVKKSCQRTFQALRIDVNQEFEVLYEFLEKLPEVLDAGGRVAILTFHSGEDRIVKKSFKQLQKAGVYEQVSNEVIQASQEECNRNPRARSAKMRWAIKCT